MTRKLDVGVRESILTLNSLKYSFRVIVEALAARHISVSKTAVNDGIKKCRGKIRIAGGCTQAEDLRHTPSLYSGSCAEGQVRPSPDATRTPKMQLLGSMESPGPPSTALLPKICRSGYGKAPRP